VWEIPRMKVATVDDRHRIRIPDLKPGQVLAYQGNADGSVTLTPVKAEVEEPFPPGSLTKHVKEWNKEFGPMAVAMKVPVPPET
jgi:hypothetical protein